MDLDLRPQFYEGQYLGADDLSTIVDYTRTEGARHALGAHTWGIAIGLQLTEKASPGAPNRVEVTLQPGFAWDGFARPIANGRPTRLNESLFAAIPFAPALDGPGGTGRLVEVWLAYDETQSGSPQPGFETCATDDPHARVGETFRFEIGQQPISQQRGQVLIGTSTVDPVKALSTFQPGAPDLYDTSVPHQRFPFDGRPPRWLIPVGYVRWIARNQALGYFADRKLNAADNADGRSRAIRRYVGAVAERIEAAAGAIVLHERGADPLAANRFATLLASTLKPDDLLTDLVWVEGNLRVIGSTKLSGGDLLFRHGDGLDQGVPFYIARRGDDPPNPAAAARELRVAIGPNGDPNNRLVVGPEVAAGASGGEPSVAPHFVVVSSGDLGIGRRDPETRLNVVGAKVRLQDRTGPTAKRIDLRSDGTGVGVESSTDSISINATGTAPKNQVLVNPGGGVGPAGRVGIRVASPQHDVDLKGSTIKLGVEDGNGGQLVVAPIVPNGVAIEARDTAGTGTASELRLVGRNGVALPQLHVEATASQFDGNVGVGGPASGARMTVTSPSANQGSVKVFTSTSDLEFDGGTDGLFVIRNLAPGGITSLFQGRLGIGTANPQAELHVAGPRLQVDGQGGEGAVFGSEGHGAILVGSANNTVNFADMRRLGVAWNTSDANAWLTVYCKTVVEVSDERAKANIKSIVGALDRVALLRGVSYRYKGEAAGSGADRLGLIAQEVQKVVPEAVSPDERGAGIAYSTLVPLLIEAVKELKDQVAELRGEVNKLAMLQPRPRKGASTKAARAGT